MSDIWDEFEKMAVLQGLISVADEDTQPTPKTRDSLSDDAVRLLYNIEPDLEKKKSIIEIAHPETAVVGRAYDAMNSIVENEHQRHDIMTYIALKMPNGNLTQRRYVAAKKDLLDSLIRSAFTLDNQDEEGLMSLADSCAQRLSEDHIIKEAIGPLAIGAAAAGLLGIGYYFFSGAPPVESVYQNAQKVIIACDELEGRLNVTPIKQDMSYLMNLAKQVDTIKGQLTPIHSVQEAITEAQKESESAGAAIAHKLIGQYNKVLESIKSAIPGWVQKIKTMTRNIDTEERGEFMAKIHALTSSFTDTPEEKLIYALQGKADVMGQIGQFLPGTSSSPKRGGLLGAINEDLARFNAIVENVYSKAPEIQSAIAKEAEKPQIPAPPQKQNKQPQIPAPTQPNKPVAMKSPADSINADLLSQLG
jgi:hypothetical protein